MTTGIFSKLTTSDIAAAEKELSATLPPDYVSFLAAHNGLEFATPQEFTTKYVTNIPVETLMWRLFGIGSKRLRSDLIYEQASYGFQDRVPSNVIAIGLLSYRIKLCLSVSGSDKGKVYLWSPNEDWTEGEVPSYKDLILAFDSIEELLEELKIK